MAPSKNSFEWSNKQLQTLKDRWLIDGPTVLSKKLNIPYWTLHSKARRLGLGITRSAPHTVEWTKFMLSELKARYVNEASYSLAKEFGITIRDVRKKASALGLHTIAGHAKAGRERAKNSTRCNIHYFDKWTPNMAYILGFLFADGNVIRSKTSAMLRVLVSSRDISVVNFIKKELESEARINQIAPRRKTGWLSSLVIGSTIMVERLIKLGMKPRKTYNNDPFPEVPDNMFPHFVRGELDGDGWVSTSTNKVCHIGFVGSPRFITGIRDTLVRLVGMTNRPVRIKQGKTTKVARVGWSSNKDARLFREFAYPEGFEFCLDRKKNRLDKWLSVPRVEKGPTNFYTKEEEDIVRNYYHTVGPAAIGRMINRDGPSVTQKALSLGVRIPGAPGGARKKNSV